MLNTKQEKRIEPTIEPSEKIKKLFNTYQVDWQDLDWTTLQGQVKDYSSEKVFIDEVLMPKIKDLSQLDRKEQIELDTPSKSILMQIEREAEEREINREYNLIDLFNKPKIIGLIGDTNEGKSNLIYYVMDELNKNYKFKLYAFGLRSDVSYVKKIYSIQEIEQISNSIIIIDEMFSLFDLDNRKVRRQIENTIRLIFHNNNVLLLSGLGENFKKFISAKLHTLIFKKVTFADLINGSRAKSVILDYNGMEKGSTILNLQSNEAIVFDGHYHKINVPYIQKYDLKSNNVPIIVQKNNVQKNVL